MPSLNSLVRWSLMVAIALVFLATGVVIWLRYTALPNTHLISGVPYAGQYLGTELSNQEPVAIRTIINYWKIGDVSNKELAETFESDSFKNVTKLKELGTEFAAEFLTNLGYTTERTRTSDARYIKRLIANNIPVYVKQGLGSDYLPGLESVRIYIGYSDKDQQFIVHDNNFGNNYIISYDEYEKISKNQVVLAVYPPNYKVLNRPRFESADPASYPPRLAIMDDPGLHEIQVKIMELNFYKVETLIKNNDRVAEAKNVLEEILAHEAFTRLHPAAQMLLSYNLAGFYMDELPNTTPNYARAIEVLEGVTLPLIENYDFAQPYGGWERRMDTAVYKNPLFNSNPWASLGHAYLKSGDKNKATDAFKKALEYNPQSSFALEGLKEAQSPN